MRIGITFSSLDLFHTGHLAILKQAKKKCDYLIVGLQLDPSLDRHKKNFHGQSIIEKYNQLKDSGYVNEIVPYVSEQDIDDILRSFKIDVLIIREKYKSINFSGKEYCTNKGIEIYCK